MVYSRLTYHISSLPLFVCVRRQKRVVPQGSNRAERSRIRMHVIVGLLVASSVFYLLSIGAGRIDNRAVVRPIRLRAYHSGCDNASSRPRRQHRRRQTPSGYVQRALDNTPEYQTPQQSDIGRHVAMSDVYVPCCKLTRAHTSVDIRAHPRSSATS